MKTRRTHVHENSRLLLIMILLSLLIAFMNTAFATVVNDSLLTAKTGRGQQANHSYKFAGYFDTYFFTNFNNPSTRNNLGDCSCARGFDRFVNQFQLGMVLTQFSYTHRTVEFNGEIGFGPNMQYASYGSAYGYKWGTIVASNTYTAVFIKQAFIKLNVTDKLSLDMGQFGTHIGYEVIDAPLNFHYSISNTFNSGVPFYHVGLKAIYSVSKKVRIMAGVVNGTDNINNNNNHLKFIGQISLVLREGFDISFNTIQGNEANAQSNGRDTASYFGILDLTSSYQLTERLKLSLWAMYGSQQGEFQGGTYFTALRHWSGLALYTQYKVNDHFSLGTRLEHFNNRDGVRALLTNGMGTYARTFTLTGNILLAEGALTLKPELRVDNFQKFKGVAGENAIQQFADRHGNFNKHSQATLGMAAIIKF
jgi:hypothetical protein